MKRMLLIFIAAVPAVFAAAQTTIDETRPAAPNGSVNIEIVVGDVKVIGWDRAEVQVQGRLGKDVEKFTFEVSGDSAEIEVRVPRRLRNLEADAHLTVHVPAGSSLNVEVVNAPVHVSNVVGAEIDIESVNGGITIEGASEVVNVEAVNGKIVVTGTPRSVEAETVSGSIRVSDVGESFSGGTVSGGVELTGAGLRRVRAESVSGGFSFTGSLAPSASVNVDCFSGGVSMTFTEEPSGAFDIETFSGGISANFGPEAQRTSRFGPGRELHFTWGEGEAKVKIETFSGSVTLSKP